MNAIHNPSEIMCCTQSLPTTPVPVTPAAKSLQFLSTERAHLDRFLPGFDHRLQQIPVMEFESRSNPGIAMFKAARGPALLIPQAFGGLGASPVDATRILRAIGNRAPSLGIVATMHNFSVSTLVEWAIFGEEYGQLLLTGLAESCLYVASGFAEGRSGGRPLDMRMKARRAPGGGWLVSGHKKPCTLAHSMDFLSCGLSAQTEDGTWHRAVGLIPADTPGIERREFWKSPILAGAESDEVIVTDAHVPDDFVFIVDSKDALNPVEVTGYIWFQLALTSTYLGIVSGLIEKVLVAEKGNAEERAQLVMQYENAASALDGIGYALQAKEDQRSLLSRALSTRFSTQATIEKLAMHSTELLGGMAFISSPDVAYRMTACRAMAFHPPVVCLRWVRLKHLHEGVNSIFLELHQEPRREEESPTMTHYDAIIVGASIGGCTAAMTLARQGWRIALLERSPDEDHYKKLCTHFIQPAALPALERLRLVEKIEAAGGVRTAMRLCTEFGWIDGSPDDPRQRGLNLARAKLDPLLRQAAAQEPGVELFTGCNVVELHWNLSSDQQVDQHRVTGVTAVIANQPHSFNAAFVIAADGRNSTVARLANIPASTDRNDRFSYYTYYPGNLLTAGGNANFWHQKDRLAFAYENGDGTSLLGIFLPLSKLREFRDAPAKQFHRFWQNVPSGPAIGDAEPLTELRGYVSYPNQTRPAVAHGVALIGDASMSIDPMWAAGCSFAIRGAHWLGQAFQELPPARHCTPSEIQQALRQFENLHRLGTRVHYWQIKDFSRLRAPRLLERFVFSAAVHDRSLALKVFAMLERRACPLTLAYPSTLIQAARVHWHQVARSVIPNPHKFKTVSVPPPSATT